MTKEHTPSMTLGDQVKPANLNIIGRRDKETMLFALRKISEDKGVLTDAERAEMDELERKIRTLLEGGYLGSPKRELNF